MRTAICLSGQPREVAETWPTFAQYLYSALPNPDVFIHTSEAYNVPEFLDTIKPKAYVIAPQFPFPKGVDVLRRIRYHNLDHANSYLQEAHGCKQIWNLVEQHEVRENFQYDFVVRTRPDLLYMRPMPLAKFDLNAVNAGYPNLSVSNEFALGPRGVMAQYFGLFDWLMTTGETWLHAENFRLAMHSERVYQSWIILATYLLDFCKVAVRDIPDVWCHYRIMHCEKANSYKWVMCP